MESSYYLQMGSFEDYRRMSRADRMVIRRELIRFTKPLRDPNGGSFSGHPKTDRRSGF